MALLAYYHEFGMNWTLLASLNALLRELAVPPLVRARQRERSSLRVVTSATMPPT